VPCKATDTTEDSHVQGSVHSALELKLNNLIGISIVFHVI
jgi:hypothetical protein